MLSIALAVLASATPADLSQINWVHDDWAAAKTQAAEKNKLVAVDVWATWCHTCLSMKNFVLTQKPMRAVKNQHVYLSLDYDRETNATFFEKYPVNAFPTFMVVDPVKGEVVARWVGSGTAKEMASFLASADPKKTDPVTRAHRANARADYKKAIAIVEKALPAAKSKADKTALLAPYIEALWKHDMAQCAVKGAPHLDDVDDTAPGIDFVAMVQYCATALDAPDSRDIMEKVAARLAPVAKNPPKSLAVDDVSGLLGALVDTYDALGLTSDGDTVARRRMALLEDAAKAEKNIDARTTFDYHRLGTFLRFKKYDEAIAMLTTSEEAQPGDFNHPWRLALVYLENGDTQAGLAAIQRALKNGYGARRLRLHTTKIDLLVKAKDRASADAQLAAARMELKMMNPSQVRSSWVKELESRVERIAALDKSDNG